MLGDFMKKLYHAQRLIGELEPFRIRCEQCYGLCCVVLYFSKMDGFPQDKLVGNPCVNLCERFTCKIHAQLAEKKMKGCMSYDCFGAGPQISSRIAKQPNWHTMDKFEASSIFQEFTKMTSLYQTMWYLTLSMYLYDAVSCSMKIKHLLEEGKHLQQSRPIDDKLLVSYQTRANQILKKLTQCIADSKNEKPTSLIGADLRGKDLSYVDVSMCCMIGANISKAKLYGTNFLGADTRDVIVEGCDMRDCLYLTQMQLNAMHGNKETNIPVYLQSPSHWKGH